MGGTKSLLYKSLGVTHNAPNSEPNINFPEEHKMGFVSAICI